MTSNAQDLLREQLKAELARRKRINIAYSLRAFARDLNLTSGFLSSLLSGQKRVSHEKFAELSKRIGLPSDQISQLLGIERSDDVEGNEIDDAVKLQLQAFQTIADWYHFALLELSHCDDFKSDSSSIAKRLGITETEARQAIDRLLNLGLLTKDNKGRLKKTDTLLSTGSGTPSKALRSYHKQYLEKAKDALETQTLEERDITNLVFAIDPENLPELKKEIFKFRRKISKLMDGKTGANPKAVYQLGVQLFRVDSTLK